MHGLEGPGAPQDEGGVCYAMLPSASRGAVLSPGIHIGIHTLCMHTCICREASVPWAPQRLCLLLWVQGAQSGMLAMTAGWWDCKSPLQGWTVKTSSWRRLCARKVEVAWVETPVLFVLRCDPACPLGRTWPQQWSMVLSISDGHDKHWIQPISSESELMQREIILPPEWNSLFCS